MVWSEQLKTLLSCFQVFQGRFLHFMPGSFGVAFPGEYESGDFEEDYDDINDDLFVLPPPLSPLDIQLLDKDTELSNENNIQVS